jgi:hypothetical protein
LAQVARSELFIATRTPVIIDVRDSIIIGVRSFFLGLIQESAQRNRVSMAVMM